MGLRFAGDLGVWDGALSVHGTAAVVWWFQASSSDSTPYCPVIIGAVAAPFMFSLYTLLFLCHGLLVPGPGADPSIPLPPHCSATFP